MSESGVGRVRDGFVAVGCILVAVGAGMAWLPAGFMVGGLLLAGIGFVGSMRGGGGA